MKGTKNIDSIVEGRKSKGEKSTQKAKNILENETSWSKTARCPSVLKYMFQIHFCQWNLSKQSCIKCKAESINKWRQKFNFYNSPSRKCKQPKKKADVSTLSSWYIIYMNINKESCTFCFSFTIRSTNVKVWQSQVLVRKQGLHVKPWIYGSVS